MSKRQERSVWRKRNVSLINQIKSKSWSFSAMTDSSKGSSPKVVSSKECVCCVLPYADDASQRGYALVMTVNHSEYGLVLKIDLLSRIQIFAWQISIRAAFLVTSQRERYRTTNMASLPLLIWYDEQKCLNGKWRDIGRFATNFCRRDPSTIMVKDNVIKINITGYFFLYLGSVVTKLVSRDSLLWNLTCLNWAFLFFFNISQSVAQKDLPWRFPECGPWFGFSPLSPAPPMHQLLLMGKGCCQWQ